MILTYDGAAASPKNLPGSSPQGAFLGIFLFIVKYNGAALRPNIPRLTFQLNQCRQTRKKCKDSGCKKHSNSTHALYLDDLSEAEAIDLKKQLIEVPLKRSYPLNYHERTGHVLASGSSVLQTNMRKIENFTKSNMMRINESKGRRQNRKARKFGIMSQ